MKPNLTIIDGTFVIHRFSPDQDIPNSVLQADFCSISRTTEELSIVCSAALSLSSEDTEPGWSCIKVVGPLDFSLTGILADILEVLAKAKVSILAISTFDTDYVLVKTENLPLAKTSMSQSGYQFV